MDGPYHIFLFDSPLKALSAIESKEFAVVVADQSMPEIRGIEFLKKAKQMSPDTEGIIMYGFVKPGTASDAICCGDVYRFIKKPLDNDELDNRWTYQYQGVRQQIDHILLSYSIKDACKRGGIKARTLDHGNPVASDHKPLVVTLKLKD